MLLVVLLSSIILETICHFPRVVSIRYFPEPILRLLNLQAY